MIDVRLYTRGPSVAHLPPGGTGIGTADLYAELSIGA